MYKDASRSVQMSCSKMKSLVEDVVDTILSGIDKAVACPQCRATIELHRQDKENGSNAYFCANCGLAFYKPKRNTK